MKKRGISMLILVITIIVMAIIAGTIILNISRNKQMDRAAEIAFKSDIKEFQKSIDTYVQTNLMKNSSFDVSSVTASTVEEIRVIIPNFPDRYIDVFNISKGKILYVGVEEDEENWARELKATSDSVIYDTGELPPINTDNLKD